MASTNLSSLGSNVSEQTLPAQGGFAHLSAEELYFQVLEFSGPRGAITFGLSARQFQSVSSEDFLWRQSLLPQLGLNAPQAPPEAGESSRGVAQRHIIAKMMSCLVQCPEPQIWAKPTYRMLREELLENRDRCAPYIHLFAKAGLLDAVEILLGSPRLSAAHLGKAFVEAASAGELEMMEKIARRAIPPTYRADAALAAAKAGQLHILRRFFERPGDLAPPKRFEACVQAASGGHLEVIRFLLPPGQILPPRYRKEALENAARKGRRETLAYLLANSPPLSQNSLDDLIQLAAWSGHLPTLRLLIPEEGELPSSEVVGIGLRRTAFRGHLEAAQFFLGLGVEISEADRKLTLVNSCRSGNLALVQLFIPQKQKST